MSETEKITINLSVVDLGQVDLLVGEGFYQNRTDFIRTAIRNQIDKHEMVVQNAVTRNSFVLGIEVFSRKGLEKTVAEGKRLKCYVIGMLVIENDVPPELATQAFDSIRVHGVFKASAQVKSVLGDRIQN